MDFSDRLVELRKSKDITQRQLAEALGLTVPAIQNYESKRRRPTFDITLAMAEYLDVSLDYLVGLSDDPTRR